MNADTDDLTAAPAPAMPPPHSVQPAAGMGSEAAPAWKILCVDDEPNIVAALRRLFRGSGYEVSTANSGAQALAMLELEPVDLVFSDMRMPGMSGEVYRYITKPWVDGEVLTTARQVFERHALEREKARLEGLLKARNQELTCQNETLEEKVAERPSELLSLSKKLKKNYLNSIKVFANLLEWRGGHLSGHSRRVADLARRTARAMNLPEADQQDAFIAGLMHDIGQIALPDSLLGRPVPKFSEEEMLQYRRHATLGEQALMAMDDMHVVANIIRSHHERYDGQG